MEDLGLEGVVSIGAVFGFMTAFYFENSGGSLAAWSPWLGLLAGMIAGGWLSAC